MILSAGCAGVVAAAGPFTWGCGVSARQCVGLGRFGPVGVLIGCLLGVLGRIGPAVRGPGGALFGILSRAGNAAPHKKALVFFINAGKLLADGGRLALFGGHITYNARAGVCFAALRE